LPLSSLCADCAASVGTKDLYLEVEAMAGDEPLATVLSTIEAEYLANGVDVHFIEDDFALDHETIINLWRDFDQNDDNDYNSIKINNIGSLTAPPVSSRFIDGIDSQTNTVRQTVAMGSVNYELIIDGIVVSTPPDTTQPSGGTKGLMTFLTQIQTAGGSPIVLGAPTMGPALGGFWNDQTPNAVAWTLGNNINKRVVVDDAFATAFAMTNKAMPPIVIPFTSADFPVGCSASTPVGGECMGAAFTGEGTPVIRTNLGNAYQQAVRYALFAHSYGGPSGQSELRGNDLVVTLSQGFGTEPGDEAHPSGTVKEQIGTLEHEMGHMLNLQHGGPLYDISDVFQLPLADTTINCKPNYLSVMSYSQQMPGPFLTVAEWTGKYSDGSNISLDETALNENTLLGGTPGTMVWGTPASPHAGPHDVHKHLSDATGPIEGSISAGPPTVPGPSESIVTAGKIDWDDSGTITGDLSPTRYDINNLGVSGCGVSTSDPIYHDYDDFAQMDFNFRQGTTGQFDGISAPISDFDESERWAGILKSPDTVFDGLESPVSQIGLDTVIAGELFEIFFELEDTSGAEIQLSNVFAQVFWSFDPDLVGEGNNPRDNWVRIIDNDPSPRIDRDGDGLLGEDPVDGINNDGDELEGEDEIDGFDNDGDGLIDEDFPDGVNDDGDERIDEDGPDLDHMRWVSGRDVVTIDFLTPARASDIPTLFVPGEICDPAGPNPTPADCDAAFSVNGMAFFRVVAYDGTGDTPDGVGIAGAEDDPESNFLKDLIAPFLPDGLNEKVTGKINLLGQPRVYKTEALETQLQEIIDNAAATGLAGASKKSVETARDKIKESRSEDKFWLDGLLLESPENESSDQVFELEKDAAVELMKVLGLPFGAPDTAVDSDVLTKLRAILEDIETVDRILAENAIEDATPLIAEEINCLDKANADMISAEGMLVMLDFEMAIKFRETAWVFAQKEIAGEICSEQPDTNGDVITGVVNEDIVINAAQTVTIGDATINGAVIVEGGTLIVSGDAVLNDKIEGMAGASITVESGAFVDGDIIVSGSSSSLSVTGATVNGKIESKEINSTSVTSNVLIGGDVLSEKDGTVTITGNTDINGKIEVKDTSGICTVSGNTADGGSSGCP